MQISYIDLQQAYQCQYLVVTAIVVEKRMWQETFSGKEEASEHDIQITV